MLPVTIVAGPCASVFARQLAKTDTQQRLGVLAGSASDWDSGLDLQRAAGRLLVYRLNDPGSSSELTQRIDAIAREGLIDRLLIECRAESHPAHLAQLLQSMEDVGSAHAHRAQLTSVVVAIDEASINNVLAGQRHSAVPPLLIAEQIEFANVIVLHATHGETDSARARAIVASLNSRALLLDSADETQVASLFEATSPFLVDAASEAVPTLDEGQGITALQYDARRPFHPERFWQLLQKPFPGVFRIKGIFWLATRMDLAGGINAAGSECRYGALGQWQVPVSELAPLSPRHSKADEAIERYGDRCQALVFLGQNVDHMSLRERLESCLLTDCEMSPGPASWARLADPFPSWIAETHEHECHHEGCCGH